MKQLKILCSMVFVCSMAACSDSGQSESTAPDVNDQEVTDQEVGDQGKITNSEDAKAHLLQGYQDALEAAKDAGQTMQKHSDDQQKDLSGI
ncbi:MAG: hypothetical protein GQ549_03550 [Gammaproteobacteria bacterium]|nr:hypothetical protein [Gammaproteobacteria bacterium]